MNQHYLLLAARAISWIFRPTYFALVGFALLFELTYLSLLSVSYKLTLLALVAVFTVILPRSGVYIYRRLHGWRLHHLRSRERRYVPYLLTISSYLACLHVMSSFYMPRWMGGIIVGALATQIVCSLINLRFKVSAHCAGAGGACGMMAAYSIVFQFNAVWWLMLLIMVSGLVGTARMLLRQHTLGEVVTGSVVGAVCCFLGVLL